jgi:hypothetical protein
LAASLGSATPRDDTAPYFPDLGRYHRSITTKSPDAQRLDKAWARADAPAPSP